MNVCREYTEWRGHYGSWKNSVEANLLYIRQLASRAKPTFDQPYTILYISLQPLHILSIPNNMAWPCKPRLLLPGRSWSIRPGQTAFCGSNARAALNTWWLSEKQSKGARGSRYSWLKSQQSALDTQDSCFNHGPAMVSRSSCTLVVTMTDTKRYQCRYTTSTDGSQHTGFTFKLQMMALESIYLGWLIVVVSI